jgi:hypothetical protein
MTIPPGPALLQLETAASLWTLCNLDAPPDIVLHDWKCFDLTPPGKPTTRRFLGRNGKSSSVYTSAPVIKFDPVQGIGEATDGAVLRLTGSAGAETVNIDAYIHDVTDEIEQLLCAH